MKPIKAILLVLILLIGVSCQNTNHKTFVVKAGKHFSTRSIEFVNADTLAFEFSANNTWHWQKPTKNGWSKVTGIAWNSNHQNSVRLVYMVLNDSTGVLGYYYYLNGVSPQQNTLQKGILDTIVIPHTYHCSLGYRNSNFYVKLGNRINEFNTSGKFEPEHKLRTLAHPYIGGTYTINHNWNVIIDYHE